MSDVEDTGKLLTYKTNKKVLSVKECQETQPSKFNVTF